jgi:hypothetical protein
MKISLKELKTIIKNIIKETSDSPPPSTFERTVQTQDEYTMIIQELEKKLTSGHQSLSDGFKNAFKALRDVKDITNMQEWIKKADSGGVYEIFGNTDYQRLANAFQARLSSYGKDPTQKPQQKQLGIKRINPVSITSSGVKRIG